ncbi:MAG: HD family phosphohydrolase [Limnochordia bacterium]|jgi:putative nucleotidyltransferase with HDIG domain
MAVWERVKKLTGRVFRHGLLDNLAVRQWLLASIVFVAMAGILLADFVPNAIDIAPGQVAREDIQAPRTVVNRYRTQRLKEDAVHKAQQEGEANPANYEISPQGATVARQDLEQIFEMVDLFRHEFFPGAYQAEVSPSPGGESLDRAVGLLQEELRVSRSLIIDENTLRRLLLADQEELVQLRQYGLEISDQFLLHRRISEENLRQVRNEMTEVVGELPVRTELRAALASCLAEVLRPNLVLNEEKMALIRQQASDSVEPVVILKDQIIVRKGDVVSQEQLQILSDLGMLRRRPNYLALLGIVLVVLLLLGLIGVYIFQFLPRNLQEERLTALLGLILVVMTFIAKILSLIPWIGMGYLIPVAFGGMLVALLLDSRLALMVVLVLGVITGLLMGNDFGMVFVALIGGFSGVFSVSKVSQRSDVMRAGFFAGAASFLAMVASGTISSDYFALTYSFLGLGNGLVSAVLTIGFLPYLESIFGITSPIRLLELANPNQPLLRRLLIETPGTYHHSIVVGNLAEAAAEVVHGDPLLARVGAYYHDIGKLKRPNFFVENQFGDENPHEKISPSLSTLIIISHVKEGVELARESRLPEDIVALIQQHHGTDLVKFFYHKATELNKDDGVQETDFRYGGPRPQTKEAALIMLADAVEAAVRSLARPTPDRIEALVHKIIKERLNDGQLDESDLTLKDLDKVAAAFTKVLSGIFHNRVEYPEKLLSELQGKRS